MAASTPSWVVTKEAEHRADIVVIAGGAYCSEITGLAALSLPGFPMRIECLALEPVRPILRPGLALMDRLCYLSQTARGEIVGGAEVPEAPQRRLVSCDAGFRPLLGQHSAMASFWSLEVGPMGSRVLRRSEN